MPEERVVLRAVSWREFCPWLIITRAFGLSISLQLLTLATIGVLATPVGWWVFSHLLFDVDRGIIHDRDSSAALNHVANDFSRWPGQLTETVGLPPSPPAVPQDVAGVIQELVSGPVYGIWQRMNAPYWRLIVDASLSLRGLTLALLGALWTLVVWAFIGSAITRSAALQLSVEQRPTLPQVLRYASVKVGSYVASPLLPILLVMAIAAILAVTTGIFARWNWSLWISGVLWGPGLIATFVMAVVLLGLTVAWPLMWPTISTEGTDAFDALSRSYSYTFQRPLHYLFYSMVAALIGTLGWFFVYHFSEWIIDLSFWSASWIATADRIDEIRSVISGRSTNQNGLLFGAKIMGLWVGLVRTIAMAFTYSYFWTSVTAIYLLLRRDVDQTETDEVYLAPQDETYGLPPLENDETGVADVDRGGVSPAEISSIDAKSSTENAGKPEKTDL